ncbi:hypothetical protein QFC21_003029 [Naganishia friedmannii]|uniref:Uncharacterized protein n=1 Tax=Naganishia friedmannii TaxID=89922 RepID=A0ACC2VRE4_9TREE|nr:hypothetical protein QFC21_003029 [Naganishia friedmannii]
MFELFPEMFDGTLPQEYFTAGPSDSHSDAESDRWLVGQPVVSETRQSQEPMMPIRDATTMQGTATSQAKHRNSHRDTASEKGSRASRQTKPRTFPDSDIEAANKFIAALARDPGDSQTIMLSASKWMCTVRECTNPGPKTYHNQLRHVRAHLCKLGKSVTEQNAFDSGVRAISYEDLAFFDEDKR